MHLALGNLCEQLFRLGEVRCSESLPAATGGEDFSSHNARTGGLSMRLILRIMMALGGLISEFILPLLLEIHNDHELRVGEHRDPVP